MEDRINIAEILKKCPKNMELISPVWDDIVFEEIDGNNIIIFRTRIGSRVYLTQYGEVNGIDGKCVIFPKGKANWKEFVPPCRFKNGDIVVGKNSAGSYIAIIKEFIDNTSFTSHIFFTSFGTNIAGLNNSNPRLATEYEKQRLFKILKEKGYRWNPETKELEKLEKPITPKFKVGDRIADKTKFTYRITEITDKGYKLNDLKTTFITFEEADLYFVKVVDMFDNTTLKPFDKVLVRVETGDTWDIDFFGYYNKGFYNTTGCQYKQCIPYAGNEHLLGTTEDCDSYFKTWED